MIHESFAFICESNAFNRESNAIIREKFFTYENGPNGLNISYINLLTLLRVVGFCNILLIMTCSTRSSWDNYLFEKKDAVHQRLIYGLDVCKCSTILKLRETVIFSLLALSLSLSYCLKTNRLIVVICRLLNASLILHFTFL